MKLNNIEVFWQVKVLKYFAERNFRSVADIGWVTERKSIFNHFISNIENFNHIDCEYISEIITITKFMYKYEIYF